MQPRYIFKDGVMLQNPAYVAQAASSVSPQAIAIVSSPQDIVAAGEALGKPITLAPTAVESMQRMQDPAFTDQFKAPDQIDGSRLIDGISSLFAKLEIPIGFLSKVMMLSGYHLNFIIDDSGSMQEKSDVIIKNASEHTKKNIQFRFKNKNKTFDESSHMTRWEEAEDRLHLMMSMLQYIPVNITIGFLTRPETINLRHDGKTPHDFVKDAHHQVRMAFIQLPTAGTPIYGKLHQTFHTSVGNTMHYLFTDGEPSDRSIEDVSQLVINRPNPRSNPITFISCTNDNSACNWMKELDEAASFSAELDDFESEKKEVLHDQGPAFPYSRGMWFISQLCAAINPVDLDALDESNPMTKRTMDELLGRRLAPQEYEYYFRNHPKESQFRPLYQQFAREDMLAWQILKPNSSPVYAVGAAPTLFTQAGGHGVNQPPYTQAPVQFKQ